MRYLPSLLFVVALGAQAQTDDFARCLDGLRPAARAASVSEPTWRTHTEALQPDMGVVANLDAAATP